MAFTRLIGLYRVFLTYIKHHVSVHRITEKQTKQV